MVGVPTSQGCKTCRRKKKGCDLKRPTCGQCARLSTTCTYETRKWTFKAHMAGPSEPSAGVNAIDAPPADWAAYVPSAYIQQPFSHAALKAGIVGEFWAAYLGSGQSQLRTSINLVIAAPLIPTLQHFAGQDEVAGYALDACAFMTVGRLRGDEVLLQQGKTLYGVAVRTTSIVLSVELLADNWDCEQLRNANRALQHPLQARTDGTLAACRLLGMCEIFRGRDHGQAVSTQGTGWQQHLDGTVKLLEFRGPEEHADEHGHELFLGARVGCAVAGLTNRKAAQLSSAKWRSLPWRSMSRTLTDEVVDIFVALTYRLQEQDEVFACLSNTGAHGTASLLENGLAVLYRCVQTSASLQLWEAKALKICIETGHYRDALQPAGLRDVVQNHGLGFYHLVMRYWVACMMLYSGTWLLFRRLAQLAPPKDPSGTGGLSAPRLPDPQQFASHLAMNVNYFFESGSGLLGAQYAAVPMGAALHYYAATGQLDSPEMKEMKRVFQEYRLAGFTSEFLTSIATSDKLKSMKGNVRNKQEHVKMAASWFRIDARGEESNIQRCL